MLPIRNSCKSCEDMRSLFHLNRQYRVFAIAMRKLGHSNNFVTQNEKGILIIQSGEALNIEICFMCCANA